MVMLLWVLSDQEEEVDEVLWRQLGAASKSQEPILVGDFNYPDICWRSKTAKHKWSRRFLESTDDKFLSEVVKGPRQNGLLLSLMLTNRKSLIGDVKVGEQPWLKQLQDCGVQYQARRKQDGTERECSHGLWVS
ncbi:hypothetical protein TURU_066197 [Turdus rufiventris]|nr:hypothetical protein TURU_066197 [Turdus rufiventris]